MAALREPRPNKKNEIENCVFLRHPDLRIVGLCGKKASPQSSVDLSKLTWQTDNGSEFLENKLERGLPATVRALGSDHRYIPPKHYTWQSDVETVHRLIEDEFFDLEDFSSRGDFLAKVHTYQLYFNLVRPNSHKQNQSPWQIIERLAPRSPLQLCLLPPVFLDYHLSPSGGYDVPRLP